MDLQEVGCGCMDWIGLAQDRDRWRTLVSELMNLLVPWYAGNFLTSCKPVSFSRRTLHHGVSKYKVNTENKLEDEKIYTVPKLVVKELSGFYVSRNSSCIFTTSCHWNISWKNKPSPLLLVWRILIFCFELRPWYTNFKEKGLQRSMTQKVKGNLFRRT